jgi:N-acetylneuraminic acid mutarotase
MNGESMTTGWYYLKAGAPTGQQTGPLSWEQMLSAARSGALSPADVVWHQSLPQWTPAAGVQGLFPAGAFLGVPAGYPAQQPPPGYQPYLGQPGAYQGGKGRSWLAWVIPLAVVVLVGAGLGIYFGAFHGKDDDSGKTTVSGKTTTTKDDDDVTTTLKEVTTTSEGVTTTEEVIIPPSTTTTEAGPVGWAQVDPPGAIPEGRDAHAMAYDPGLGKVIMFGGYGFDSALNDTWLYDPVAETWTAMNPSGTTPAPRGGFSSFFDPVSGRLVIFGGWSDDLQLDDTSAYDPITDSWSDLMPSGDYPPASAYHAMAYDPVNDKAVLFGGWDDFNAVELGGTYIYDVAANTWAEVTPTGASPSPRDSHAMVYNPVNGLIYLFGGFDDVGQLNDLWVYSVAENTWTEVLPGGGPPAPRSTHAMAVDEATGQVLVFGGYDGDFPLGDLWAYDPAANMWTELTSTGDTPADRSAVRMVYDPVSGRMIVFGGYDGEAELSDTWTYGP